MILKKYFKSIQLKWKIYLSLTAILVPVFALVIVVQTAITKPLLQDEVHSIGLSICRSLATDIKASHLLTHSANLENHLIEFVWMQPSIIRLDVLTRENNQIRVLASNIAEDIPSDVSSLALEENTVSQLKQENNQNFWEITYPVKDRQNHILAYIHVELSLHLVDRIVGTFTKITLLGVFLSMVLLMGLLSYYLRRTIENERKLRVVERTNVALTDQIVEMQNQLHLNDKLALVGQLTASFAHEIGTPLNSLSGHVQLLRDEVHDTNALNRLGIIRSQISRIEHTVKSFLESSSMPPQQKELVDMEPMFSRLLQLLSPRLQQLNVHSQVDIAQPLEPVRIVPSELEQILLNLANNALDAIQSKQMKTALQEQHQLKFLAKISSEGSQRVLTMQVIDTGEGIDKNTLKNVLKPFFTTKARGQGTGLGLSICQRLVKKNGGRLEIYSQPGQGTTVSVVLPLD